MRVRWEQVAAGVALLGAGIAGGWAIGASGGGTTIADPGPGTPPEVRVAFGGELVAYDSCAGLADAVRERARAMVGPYGFGPGVVSYASGTAAMAPAASTDKAVSGAAGGTASSSGQALTHSVTNTQVVGVDEPDVVKTDGRVMVSIDGQRLHIVDVRSPQLLSTLALPHPGSELLLAGERAVVLSGEPAGGRGPMPLGAAVAYGSRSETIAMIVDLSDPAHPRVVRTFSFDAGEIAARVVGGTIRLVLRSAPPVADWETPRDGTDAERRRATKANQGIVDALPLDSWLPHWTADTGSGASSSRRLSACGAVAVPKQPTGSAARGQGSDAGIVTVVSLDPAATDPGAGTSVFGGGTTAYAEGEHLYVAGEDYLTYPSAGGKEVILAGRTTTQLFEFDISDPGQARFLASGSVPGALHDSYALSEYQDRLRVTTTDRTTGRPTSSGTTTAVTVLERRGDQLVQVGTLDGLGAGEQVYAVRYLGDRAYVVTFRQIDPIHVIDLSNPNAPVLRGFLELPGYSSLLQPLPDHKLLGIGRSVSTGFGGGSSGAAPSCAADVDCADVIPAPPVEPDGLQISLFDVADPAHPRLLHQQQLTGAYAQDDSAHALAADPAGGYFLLPSSRGLLAIHTSGSELRVDPAPFAAPDNQQAGRALFAGTRVFELTDRGVAVRNAANLKQTGWVGF